MRGLSVDNRTFRALVPERYGTTCQAVGYGNALGFLAAAREIKPERRFLPARLDARPPGGGR